MKNLPLSALSSALLSVGLFGYTSSAQALECSTSRHFLNNQNESVNNCQVDVQLNENGMSTWINANQTTLAFNNNNINGTSVGDITTSLVQAVNSNLSFTNNTFNLKTDKAADILRFDNSTVTIRDSHFNATVDEIGGVIDVRNQSTVTLTNSTVTSNQDVFVFSDKNNKLTLNDSQVMQMLY